MVAQESCRTVDHMRFSCKFLNVNPISLLRRSGLSENYFDADRSVTAAELFVFWEALRIEYSGFDLAPRLAQVLARGPLIPTILCFSCGPDTEQGLIRLVLFKQVSSAVKLSVFRQENTLRIVLKSSDPELPIPEVFAQFKLLYLLECARLFTDCYIVPIAIGASKLTPGWDAVASTAGVQPKKCSEVHMTLSLADAQLPLISHKKRLWEEFGSALQKQVIERPPTDTATERVRNALLEGLPSGTHSTNEICARLNISKRTLQRRLKDEMTSFQEILDKTRYELSQDYLKQPRYSLHEISFLLGFSEPSSFFRAFQGWTGKTPMEVRIASLN